MGQMTHARAEDFINLDAYPIDGHNPDGLATVLADARAQLAEDGCCILRDFIRPEMIPVLAAEGDNVAAFAHRSFNRTNAYFS